MWEDVQLNKHVSSAYYVNDGVKAGQSDDSYPRGNPECLSCLPCSISIIQWFPSTVDHVLALLLLRPYFAPSVTFVGTRPVAS